MSNVEGALKALIVQTVTEMGLVGGQAGGQAGGTPQQQPAADPFGGMGGTQQPAQQPQQVTAEMIQQLVMPLVQNEQTKAKLTAEMNAMGIQSLADVQPHQMNELYQRFERVKNEANQQPANTGGGASGGII